MRGNTQHKSSSATLAAISKSNPWVPLATALSQAGSAFSFPSGSTSPTAFGVKGNTVFFNNKPIPGSDAASFFVATDPMVATSSETSFAIFAKDAHHVYAITSTVYGDAGVHILAGATPNTFLPLYSRAGLYTGYAKDNASVYYSDIAYAQDNAPVTKVPGAEPATFVPLIDSEGSVDNASGSLGNQFILTPLAKDASHVYLGSTTLPSVDAATFTALSNRNVYFKDKNTVYYYVYPVPCLEHSCNDGGTLQPLSSADYATFSLNANASTTASYDAYDKNHRYLMGYVVPSQKGN